MKRGGENGWVISKIIGAGLRGKELDELFVNICRYVSFFDFLIIDGVFGYKTNTSSYLWNIGRKHFGVEGCRFVCYLWFSCGKRCHSDHNP